MERLLLLLKNLYFTNFVICFNDLCRIISVVFYLMNIFVNVSLVVDIYVEKVGGMLW